MMGLLLFSAVMLSMTSLFLWQVQRQRIKKRVWRQVQVTNLVKVKQHKVGPLELIGESGLLVELSFSGKQYCCHTSYRDQLCQSFSRAEPTFILIDPTNPTQCYHNASQQTRFAKLWFLMSLTVLCCVLLSEILSL